MIVDTSVLVAILRQEPEARSFTRALAASTSTSLSAASYLETGIVIDGRGDPIASRQFDNLIARSHIRIEPVTVEQATIARDAYRDFGRGSGHPARLNFGGCFTYALAKALNEPLLFKGDNFVHTDITPALG